MIDLIVLGSAAFIVMCVMFAVLVCARAVSRMARRGGSRAAPYDHTTRLVHTNPSPRSKPPHAWPRSGPTTPRPPAPLGVGEVIRD